VVQNFRRNWSGKSPVNLAICVIDGGSSIISKIEKIVFLSFCFRYDVHFLQLILIAVYENKSHFPI
jgi:hypothetical protein